MSRLVLIRLVSLLALLACAGCTDVVTDDDDTTAGDDDDTTAGDDDSDGDDDSTAGDDDSAVGDDDDDDTPVAVQAPSGSVLCAAGGRVSSAEGITGVVCTSPLELASGQRATSADGSLIWHPGPITRIAP